MRAGILLNEVQSLPIYRVTGSTPVIDYPFRRQPPSTTLPYRQSLWLCGHISPRQTGTFIYAQSFLQAIKSAFAFFQ